MYWGDIHSRSSVHHEPVEYDELTSMTSNSLDRTTSMASHDRDPWNKPHNGLKSVMHKAISAIRQDLSHKSMENLFCPPLSVALKDRYYPDDVATEDPKYFTDEMERDSHRVHAAVMKQQSFLPKRVGPGRRTLQTEYYPFDRREPAKRTKSEAASRNLNVVLKADWEGPTSSTSVEDQKFIHMATKDLSKAKKSDWYMQHQTAFEQKNRRLKHMLHVLMTEQEKECRREVDAMKIRNDKVQSTQHKKAMFKERNEAADRVMRILHDYRLITGGEMGNYLFQTIKDVQCEILGHSGAMEGKHGSINTALHHTHSGSEDHTYTDVEEETKYSDELKQHHMNRLTASAPAMPSHHNVNAFPTLQEFLYYPPTVSTTETFLTESDVSNTDVGHYLGERLKVVPMPSRGKSRGYTPHLRATPEGLPMRVSRQEYERQEEEKRGRIEMAQAILNMSDYTSPPPLRGRGFPHDIYNISYAAGNIIFDADRKIDASVSSTAPLYRPKLNHRSTVVTKSSVAKGNNHASYAKRHV